MMYTNTKTIIIKYLLVSLKWIAHSSETQVTGLISIQMSQFIQNGNLSAVGPPFSNLALQFNSSHSAEVTQEKMWVDIVNHIRCLNTMK